MSTTALNRDFATALTADATGEQAGVNNLVGYGLMGVAALALLGTLMGGGNDGGSSSPLGGAGMIAAVLALGAIVVSAMNRGPDTTGLRGPRII